MNVEGFCKYYFNGFNELYNYRKNSVRDNAVAFLKVISYFTIIIPLSFGVIYELSSLFGRINKKTDLTALDTKVNNKAVDQLLSKPTLPENKPTPVIQPAVDPIVNSNIIQTPNSKVVHVYTGDLTDVQKGNLKATLNEDKTLEIGFKQFPNLSFSIRIQDIFNSSAEVIVNAANSHLGGGGGIDGAIHDNGGSDYAKAHKELQKEYNSNYVLGHAAMITSGSIKEKHKIDHVIVVAGPQGESNPQKENELYSCYYNSLLLAHSQNKTSIAFPAISTGIFGFSKDRAASISLKALSDFMDQNPSTCLKTISIHFQSDNSNNLKIYIDACTTTQTLKDELQ